MGKTHSKKYPNDGDEQVPKEFNALSVVASAGPKKAQRYVGAAFYAVRAYMDYLADQFGVAVEYLPIDSELSVSVSKPFELSRSAMIKDVASGKLLGIIGEFSQKVHLALKLPQFTAGFELDLDELLHVAHAKKAYKILSRYPGIASDVTFRTLSTLTYQRLVDAVEKALADNTQDAGFVYRLSSVGAFQPNEQTSSRNITLHIELSHPVRTLTTDESNTVIDTVVAAVQKQAIAERV